MFPILRCPGFDYIASSYTSLCPSPESLQSPNTSPVHKFQPHEVQFWWDYDTEMLIDSIYVAFISCSVSVWPCSWASTCDSPLSLWQTSFQSNIRLPTEVIEAICQLPVLQALLFHVQRGTILKIRTTGAYLSNWLIYVPIFCLWDYCFKNLPINDVIQSLYFYAHSITDKQPNVTHLVAILLIGIWLSQT